MTLIVLFAVAAGWACYAALWLRADRSTSSARGNSIDSFRRSLGSLGEAGVASARARLTGGDRLRPPGLLSPPLTSVQAARRRAQVTTALAALAFGSLMAVSFAGLPGLVAHVIADVALLGFFYAVVRRRHLIAEREIMAERHLKVVRLYPDRPAVGGEFALARMQRAAGD